MAVGLDSSLDRLERKKKLRSRDLEGLACAEQLCSIRREQDVKSVSARKEEVWTTEDEVYECAVVGHARSGKCSAHQMVTHDPLWRRRSGNSRKKKQMQRGVELGHKNVVSNCRKLQTNALFRHDNIS